MHIPDGFLDAKTALTSGVLAVAGVGLALRTVRRSVPARRVPLIGLTAAFVFVAQMLNFPVAGGTSGHLIGAVLAAVLLGPSAAVLVMTAVLILQCLMFADGGVTALGANLFNMAIVAPGVGYAIYAIVRRLAGGGLRARLLGTAFAAWCSTVTASIACAGQLALSGTVAWGVALPAMSGIHALIGIGEALISALVVAGVAQIRPELLAGAEDSSRRARHGASVVHGLLISLGLAIFVAPFASAWPDGLERVASRLGFEHRAVGMPLLASPLHDYTLPGVRSVALSTILAGCAGTGIAFGLAYLLARALTPRSAAARSRPAEGGSTDASRPA